ncbi:chemotaxis protein CheB [Helicobacter sp. 13S00401-1]|uniref:CheB methylesterase domain-containing protein n=1 Tax=Helicobacter sp. 13S00401-1 TaxID=1905758 RepID=UPI000BA73339|nr:CheB methylesterase domain-containing protein [Helicobacter sp. 13S00401-1]PAF50791.1 chemotaxis protein CheB [Helicobacter sp. 13S00401-1]
MRNKTPYLVEEKHHPDTILPSKPAFNPKDRLIVIGSSTGGTEALNTIFSKLPRGLPPIIVVQHIPKTFSASLVQRLDANSALDVYEVTEKMVLQDSAVYVAAGDCHVLVGSEAGKCIVKPFEERRISRHKPSVDILFRSANNLSGPNTLAIILTGMGDDGSIGMKELFDNGAYTIAQDEKSCVVFGMPKKAIEAGAVREVLPLEKIPARIVELSSKKSFSCR